MNKAIDVASYILQEKGCLTGYQLQKLLYYCQAWSLVTQDAPLFDERVKAWEHGPVVYEVAKLHRSRSYVAASGIGGNPGSLSARDKDLVDSVLDAYGSMSGDDLADLSHSEEPWLSVYNGHSGLLAAEITRESMLDYYSRLMASDPVEREKHHVPIFNGCGRMFVSDRDFEWLLANAI